jgi:pSer/pThr/pTyr-binding forkhead associated (FHA) protein
MKACKYCSHSNREGMFFCEECGRRIGAADALATLPTKQLDIDDNTLNIRSTWGTARFEQDSTIILHVRDATEPLIISPHNRVVIGRMDASSERRPDVDLTPYKALEYGVSRIHAAIQRDDETLVIVDLASANGTHLNGQRLTPEQPRVLRDGDEIHFGKMVVHVYFKSD